MLKRMFSRGSAEFPRMAKWNPDDLIRKCLGTEFHSSPLGLTTFLPSEALSKLAMSLASNQKTLECFGGYVLLDNHPGLPGWWHENGNRAFVPAEFRDAPLPKITSHPDGPSPDNACLFLNGKHDFSLWLWGSNALFHISPKAHHPSALITIGGSFVFIGDDVRSNGRMYLNCINGGNIILESDILIGSDVSLMTDDCHAILSKSTRSRVNPYGGTIWVRNHVWLGENSRVMGNTLVQHSSIIGVGAFVRGVATPPNSVLAGVPAKVVQSNVTWDSRDLPPDSPLIQELV